MKKKKKKIKFHYFYFGQKNLVCFSESLDPDPHRDKRPDQDPHQMYADPQH